MTSRWASSRRGGMTVLGKVPKPLNLPSQRFENHGVDPKVEIVPKGTLSWGSHPSSSASNAWGSSTLSSNPDGGCGSPSHLIGRPSSGGSGTRPSTAGSDRMHEPSANALGQNSRPSSASGASSNQTSLASLRPCSAETRPGSSQLSRFAESSSDNSVAWGPSCAAEKLVVPSFKNDGFTLSSGDFPTLGSERDKSVKNMDLPDHGCHGRPNSSSGRIASAKERTATSQADVNSGAASMWKRDGPQHVEENVQHIRQNWQQGESQHYLNANIPPPHFNAWHGPPMNAPPGVWYRGPPGGPPHGTPIAPGGFPMNPYPYYHPQIPPPALANSQPFPRPGAGPRGHHPKNGDLYRPQMPDTYIRPGMPIRPVFYPGPVAYEGYYGPPMGYCSSNEQDIPFVGMAAGPSVYNRYPAQSAPDPSNTHTRDVGHGSTAKTLAPEHVDYIHPQDTLGHHKALKQHSESDGKKEENWQYTVPANAPSLDRDDQPRALSQKNEWGVDHDEIYSRKMTVGEHSSRTFDSGGSYSFGSVEVKMPQSKGNVTPVDDSWVKNSEISPSSSPEVPQLFPDTTKDSPLMQKIEGLNAKARTSDGRHDSACTPRREAQNRLRDVNAKANSPKNEADIASFERSHTTGILIPSSRTLGVSMGDKIIQPTGASRAVDSRRPYHGGQGRIDHQSRGWFNRQDGDGWQKKSLAADSSDAVSDANSKSTDVHADCVDSVKDAEKSEMQLPVHGGESFSAIFDSSDCQAQRAKMRELATQRAMQLQKEEEERMRDQKAKALEKLEELNRRTRAGDCSTQKLERDSTMDTSQLEQEEPKTLANPMMGAIKCDATCSGLISKYNVVAHNGEGTTGGVKESTVQTKDSLLDTPKCVQQEPVIPPGKSFPLKQEVDSARATDTSLVNDVVSRHKRMSYKQKHNASLERKLTEKSSIGAVEALNNHAAVVNDVVSSDDVPVEVSSSGGPILSNNLNTMAESAHQRKTNNRNGKNKYKLDDVSSAVALASPVTNETNNAKPATESGKAKVFQVGLEPCSVQSVTGGKEQSSEQHSAVPSQDVHGKVNNQWKSHHSRRMPRNPQVNRSADKFHSSDAVIWAPVRSQNKTEVADEGSQRTVPDDALTPLAKTENFVPNNVKSKRAEMERYVPKPVAKELAQQGSIQPPVSSTFSQTTSDEIAGSTQPGSQSYESSQPASCIIGNVESTLEPKNGDRMPTKQAKTHGTWRQRGLTESSHVQDLQHGSSFDNNVHKPREQQFGQKYSVKWDTSDGWNTPDNSDATTTTTATVVKDQGATSKGKRQLVRGHRSSGIYNELDNKDIDTGGKDKGYIQSASKEVVALKENRGARERMASHWQPKAYSANNHQGSRSSGGHHVIAEVGRAVEKESPLQVCVFPPQNDTDRIEVMAQPLTDESVPQSKKVAESSNLGPLESRRERQAASSKERPYSPNQGPVSTDEQAPANSDSPHQQRFSTRFRKNGKQNNRSGRRHESHGDGGYAEKDNMQPHGPAHRDRDRHYSHYEYQRVEPANNGESNNFEGPRDGSSNVGSKYRERGQSYSRHGGGNLFGRQSGTAQGDGGYN